MSNPIYPNTSHKYAYFWGKYRPALLKLMIDCAEQGPQQYKFSSHEVRSASAKEKGHTFLLKVHHGKAVNNVRESPIAKDLLWILQQSSKANELTESSVYEFALDRKFVLHVTKEVEKDKTDPLKIDPIVAEGVIAAA